MEKIIFNHMDSVRGITLKTISETTEEEANHIPAGFNNNIRWNLGHVAFIQERVTVQLLGEKMGVPKLYKFLFAPGTSPNSWQFPAPTLEELYEMMSEQNARLQDLFTGRLEEQLDPPFTNGMGLTFNTIGESLLFTIYHEGWHMGVIKRIKASQK